MVRAIGGLITFLLQNKIINELEDVDSPFILNAIETFTMYYIMQSSSSDKSRERCLTIDANTLEALQIFSTDDHPSMIRKGRAKEGLSLFGIMDHTVDFFPAIFLMYRNPLQEEDCFDLGS